MSSFQLDIPAHKEVFKHTSGEVAEGMCMLEIGSKEQLAESRRTVEVKGEVRVSSRWIVEAIVSSLNANAN